jgi:Lrp/AsnC family transcriptional regulator, leucine-responsive regulatory protein
VQFVCTAPPVERAEYVDLVLDVQGVIDVREMLFGRQNIYIEAVGTSTQDITRITDVLHEMDLTVESAEMMRKRHIQPFNHFYFSDEIIEETQER